MTVEMDFSKNILEFHTSENAINHLTQYYNTISKKFYYINTNPNSVWHKKTMSLSAFKKLNRKSSLKKTSSSILHSCMKNNKVKLSNTKNIKKVTFSKRLCSYRSINFISIYNLEGTLNPWSKWIKIKEFTKKSILNNIYISNFNYFAPLDLEFFYNSIFKPPPWGVELGTTKQKMNSQKLLSVYSDSSSISSTKTNSISKIGANHSSSTNTNFISNSGVTQTAQPLVDVSLRQMLSLQKQTNRSKKSSSSSTLLDSSSSIKSDIDSASNSNLVIDSDKIGRNPNSVTENDKIGKNSNLIISKANSSYIAHSTNDSRTNPLQLATGILSTAPWGQTSNQASDASPKTMVNSLEESASVSSISSTHSTPSSGVGDFLPKSAHETRLEKIRLSRSSLDEKKDVLEQSVQKKPRNHLEASTTIPAHHYEIPKTVQLITESVILNSLLDITTTYVLPMSKEPPSRSADNMVCDIEKRISLSNDILPVSNPASRLSAKMASLDVHPESGVEPHIHDEETYRLYDEPHFRCGGILLTGILTHTKISDILDALRSHLPHKVFARLKLSNKERSKLSLSPTLMPHSLRHHSLWIDMNPLVVVQKYSRIVLSSTPIYLNFMQDGYRWNSDDMSPIAYARGFSDDLDEAGAMSIGLCNHLTINRTQTLIVLAPIYIVADKSNNVKMPYENLQGYFPTVAGIIVTTKINSKPLANHILMLTKIDTTQKFVPFGVMLVRGCYYDIHLNYTSIQKYKFFSEHIGKTAKLCVDITNPYKLRISELMVCIQSWPELNTPGLFAYFFLSNDSAIFSVRLYCVQSTWSATEFLAGFIHVVHPLPQATVKRYNPTDLYCLRLNLLLASRMSMPGVWTSHPPVTSFIPFNQDDDITRWNSFPPIIYQSFCDDNVRMDEDETNIVHRDSMKVINLQNPFVTKSPHDFTPYAQLSTLTDGGNIMTQHYIECQSKTFNDLRDQHSQMVSSNPDEDDDCDTASQGISEIKLSTGLVLYFPPPNHLNFTIPKFEIPQLYEINQITDCLLNDNDITCGIPGGIPPPPHPIKLAVTIDSLTLHLLVDTVNINKLNDLLMTHDDSVFLEDLELLNNIVHCAITVEWHDSFEKWQAEMPDDGNSLLYSILSSEWLSQKYYPFQLNKLTKARQKMVLYSRWGPILESASANLANNSETVYGVYPTSTGEKYLKYIYSFNAWALNTSTSRPVVDFDLLISIFPNGAPYTEWTNHEDGITPHQTTLSLDPHEKTGENRQFSLLALYQILRSSCHTLNDGDDNYSPLIFQVRMADKLMAAWYKAFPLLREMVYRGMVYEPGTHIFISPPDSSVPIPSREEWRAPNAWVYTHTRISTKQFLKTKLDPVYFRALVSTEQPDNVLSQFKLKNKN